MCVIWDCDGNLIGGDLILNIYDFDGTIYDGDSSVDFYKYCVKRDKKCLAILPNFLFTMGLYLLKICEKEKMKSAFFSFVKYFDNIEDVVMDFWASKNYELKEFYLKQKRSDDIVISASPSFLLEPIAKKYGFKLISTEVDVKTGRLIGKNCHGKEKVERLKEKGISECREFYSDSMSDEPLANISKSAYILDKNDIILWKDYKESTFKKLKRQFFSQDFITFVAIGVINVFNGIWIAYVYSLFITDAVLAYILGFLTSLVISYILNSLLNFKEKLSLSKFVKFAISNIPNFLIQVFSVKVLIDILTLPKLLSYGVSAVIAVPITFLLVKTNVFANKE